MIKNNMKEQEIITQLNKLRSISPQAEWKAVNRKILFTKIESSPAASQDVNQAKTAFIFRLPVKLIRTMPQPVMAVIFIILFMAASGAASVMASKNSKPGDSLYVAKIISEKTHYALTFNEHKKAQLGITFATNRVKEISQVLADESNGGKGEKVERLVNDFKKEISEAKTRIAKISSTAVAKPVIEAEINEAGDNNEGESDENDTAMFSANLEKEEQGIELSEPSTKTSDGKVEKPEIIVGSVDLAEELGEDELSTVPTTTEEIMPLASSTDVSTTESANDPQKILEQAGLFLENENYNATLSKLEEAGDAIDLVGGGEVKGESESSTTTDEYIEEEGEVLGAEEVASTTLE